MTAWGLHFCSLSGLSKAPRRILEVSVSGKIMLVLHRAPRRILDFSVTNKIMLEFSTSHRSSLCCRSAPIVACLEPPPEMFLEAYSRDRTWMHTPLLTSMHAYGLGLQYLHCTPRSKRRPVGHLMLPPPACLFVSRIISVVHGLPGALQPILQHESTFGSSASASSNLSQI